MSCGVVLSRTGRKGGCIYIIKISFHCYGPGKDHTKGLGVSGWSGSAKLGLDRLLQGGELRFIIFS